ncbi:uncharacterized protein EV420DRAFT_1477397 [Desarmillaria tabescens]|uniref:DUF7770 domain-containing protein n=1 Tax=Armillaria tabescens TaxID=1929756 RepID=A0AA39N9V5_ARMTA|nr:uncharacterized protein EV420DRAFT_1477397 [Desarmillaria tabescens]KAK0461644.1 hypothetical protein EV420DRAFT_1477397 [Desarmillaria tabescens]
MATPSILQRPTVFIMKSDDAPTVLTDLKVDTVVVVGEINADRTLYHFTLSFFNSSTNASVRFDMHPSATDLNDMFRGIIVVEYLSFPFSTLAGGEDWKLVTPYILKLSATRMIGEISAAIFEKGRDGYRFDDLGQGCRH